MSYLEVFALAIALAMDAFAVSIGSGCQLRKPNLGQYFRLSFTFGFFQFMMPIIGWFLGTTIKDYIQHIDHWIAFILLAFIGIKMIKESWNNDDNCPVSDPSRGIILYTLALATSIDALAVGLSFALIEVSVLIPSLIIGIVCSLLTACGIYLGSILSKANKIGKNAELIGGFVLIGIGIKILLDHIAF